MSNLRKLTHSHTYQYTNSDTQATGGELTDCPLGHTFCQFTSWCIITSAINNSSGSTSKNGNIRSKAHLHVATRRAVTGNSFPVSYAPYDMIGYCAAGHSLCKVDGDVWTFPAYKLSFGALSNVDTTKVSCTNLRKYTTHSHVVPSCRVSPGWYVTRLIPGFITCPAGHSNCQDIGGGHDYDTALNSYTIVDETTSSEAV